MTYSGTCTCGTSPFPSGLAPGLLENMEQHPVDKAPVVPGPEQEHPILEPHRLS